MFARQRQLWLDNLRNGQYEQGEGVLCDGSKYCCLGVLTHLAMKEGVCVHDMKSPVDVNPDQSEYYLKHYGTKQFHYYDEEFQSLPKSVMEWAGLSSKNPELYYRDYHPSDYGYGDNSYQPLTELNDGFGLSFKEIADMIEAQIPITDKKEEVEE